MLFLRRTEGEGIAVFDSRTRCTIRVTRVDVDRNEIDVTIDGVGSRTLQRNDTVSFLQGDATLKFSFILDYQGKYPPAASLGIEAPRTMAIYRSERLTGLGPDQIVALCRD